MMKKLFTYVIAMCLASGAMAFTEPTPVKTNAGDVVNVQFPGSATIAIESSVGDPVYVQQAKQISGSVSVSSALPTGANVIGYVMGQGQFSATVQISSALPAGTNSIGAVTQNGTTTYDVSIREILPNDGVDIGDVGILAGTNSIGLVESEGHVSAITVTSFYGSAFGGATTKVIPTGTNWVVVRNGAIGATSITATAWGVVNTVADAVDEGTGAYVGPYTPVVWDNLNIGSMGSTVYFGSAHSGGGIRYSLEYGE